MQDTDSLVFSCGESVFDECVDEEKRATYEESRGEIFEVPNSDCVQHSRLKVEGVFRGGLFRSMKSYYLLPLIEGYLCEECGAAGGCCSHIPSGEMESRPLVRAKGLTRNVQNEMQKEHFEMSEERQPYFATYSLRPTSAQEMTIGVYTKRNSSCINFKRSVDKASSKKSFSLALKNVKS